MQPTRATFNRLIFEQIGKRFETTIIVPIVMREIFSQPGQFLLAYWGRHSMGRNVHYIPFFNIPGAQNAFAPYLLLLCFVLFAPRLALKKYDGILVSWVFPDGGAVRLFSKLKRIPYWVVALGSDINVLGKRQNLLLPIRRVLSDANQSIAVSRSLSMKMLELGSHQSKSHVIYNGVDNQKFIGNAPSNVRERLGLGKEKRIILFVGSLIFSKGIRELIGSATALCERDPHIHFVIVGSGADRKWLEQEITLLKLESRVHVVGSVMHENLPEYFSAADLFCLPSYREGVPNVLMEAMSTGKPCVASNVGGIPEVLADFCGVMHPPENTEALITAIEVALGRYWDSSRIRSHASLYSWEDTGNKYAEVIYHGLTSFADRSGERI